MANAADKEQIAMIAKFWNDYGKGILIAVIIALLLAFGWRYWSSHKVQHRAKASIVYQSLYNALAVKNIKVAHQFLTKLKTTYKDTPYASLGALFMACYDVSENQLKDALKQFNWVIQKGDEKSFQQMARIRAARIQLAQKNYSAALSTLKTINDKTFQPLVDVVKGDIYSAQGKKSLARDAFKAAEKGFGEKGLNDPFVTMKLNSMS